MSGNELEHMIANLGTHEATSRNCEKARRIARRSAAARFKSHRSA